MIHFLLLTAATLIVFSVPAATAQSNCDPAYPTVCIPSPPPDLDCGDEEVQGKGYSNFPVRQPDPHRFDGDNDGVGCEG
jgi:hypothetical protein